MAFNHGLLRLMRDDTPENVALGQLWERALHNVGQIRDPEAICLRGAIFVRSDNCSGVHLIDVHPVPVFSLSCNVRQQDIELRLHRFIAEDIVRDFESSTVVALLDEQKKRAQQCLSFGRLFLGEHADMAAVLAVIDDVIARVNECMY